MNGDITKRTATVLTTNVNAQSTTASNPTVKQATQTIAGLDLTTGFKINTAEAYRVSVVLCNT